MSTSLFTGNGSSYDQSLILTADGSLNQTAYAEYGQPYYTTTYSLASITHNLSTGASLTFVGLWYWKEIWAGWKAMRGGSTDHIDDVHFLAMKGKYREVPQVRNFSRLCYSTLNHHLNRALLYAVVVRDHLCVQSCDRHRNLLQHLRCSHSRLVCHRLHNPVLLHHPHHRFPPSWFGRFAFS